MPDVRIIQYESLAGVDLDFLLTPLGLDQAQELATAVIVALGTDGLASVDDVLPDPDSTDRRGWWGNMDAEEIWGGWPLGSRLWLLSRAKITDAAAREGATVDNARLYGEEALQPFVNKAIASAIDVTAARADVEQINMICTLYRGPLPAIELRYQAMWDELAGVAAPEVPPQRTRPASMPAEAPPPGPVFS
jgi:phage gp46-like protein